MSHALLVGVGLLFLFHVVGFILLLRNQFWMKWPPGQRHRPTGNLTVTVIVPVRNEAMDVGRCLKSLLAQNYNRLKVIAINDHSDDTSPAIMDDIVAQDRRLIVIHNPPLQAGWLGKQNAMQAAAAYVDSDLVLVTDADVIFQPDCMSAAVGELEKRHMDLLSLYPQFEFVTFCETMLLPIYVGGAALLLSPDVENPRSQRALAVGAFILMRTDRFRQIGEFRQLRTTILDDVGMAILFKTAGYRLGIRSAPDLMQVRFFKDNAHAFFGVTKHLHGMVQNRLWLAPVLAMVPFCMYATLLWGTIAGVLQARYGLATLSALTLSVHYGALLLSQPGNKFNALLALAFPLMSIQFAASCLRATYLLMVRNKFEWRGRITDLSVKHNANDATPPQG